MQLKEVTLIYLGILINCCAFDKEQRSVKTSHREAVTREDILGEASVAMTMGSSCMLWYG